MTFQSPIEQLTVIIESINSSLISEKSNCGSSVILIGPRGAGKSHAISKALINYPSELVYYFPGALVRPSLCPDPQSALIKMMMKRNPSNPPTESLEEYFEKLYKKESKATVLIIEDLDYLGGGIKEQAFLYTLFELTLTHSLLIIATTCRLVHNNILL